MTRTDTHKYIKALLLNINILENTYKVFIQKY